MKSYAELQPLIVSLLVIELFLTFTTAYDTLMVVGGYYHENSANHYLRAVEVLGKHNSCIIAPLPQPRMGLTLARLKKSVIACGGFYNHDRYQCFQYFPRLQRWVHTTNLPHSNAFGSSVGEGVNLFVVGGRFWDHDTEKYVYMNNSWQYNAQTRNWTALSDLPTPTADGCLLALNGDLIFIGGAKDRYMYESEPSNVWVLHQGSTQWRDDVLAELLAARMWHSCLIAQLEDEVGIVVAGGYYNGMASMFLPLSHYQESRIEPRWRWLGSLPEERKWGPALGSINGILTLAGGQDYGDDSIDQMNSEGDWQRIQGRNLQWKREFSAHVTVPSQWFPECGRDF